MDNKYVGTDFKYALTITSEGFMMERIPSLYMTERY